MARFFSSPVVYALALGAWWTACTPEEPPFAVDDVRPVPAHFPTYIEPEDNPMNEAKWELGRHLFFDERLGADGALSCASCHVPEMAFADSSRVSLGTGGIQGVRNAPALINGAWQPRFHREGGVPSLEAQVLAPIQEPMEFDRDLVALVEELSQDEQYQSWSECGFGRGFDAYVMTRSLAAFQRTLISGGSRYDAWLQGNASALNAAELRGLDVFESLECNSCHSGVLLSDFETHNTGLYANYDDVGAYRLTFDSSDIGAFQTPTLRNVALTSPYMFDGSLPALEDVVDHYVSGGTGHPNQDERVRPRTVTDQDKADLVAFLHTLSDEEFVVWAKDLRP